MPIFDIKNIYYKYDKMYKDGKYVLNNISFCIEKKDIVALIGKSGSGKSTLISHLNGILKSDRGDILYKGESIYGKDFDLTSLRFKCGVVFQYPEYQLFSETVIDDVAFGALKMGLEKKDAYKKAEEVLKLLQIEYLKDAVPFNLSGGEKRKVAFAGVFVMNPEVLIFDEPDAGLDTATKKLFYNFIKMLNDKYDKTIVFVTHNLDDVVEYANKVIIINDGVIERIGEPFDVFSDIELMKKCNLVTPYAIEIYNYLLKNGVKIDCKNLKFDNMVSELNKINDKRCNTRTIL